MALVVKNLPANAGEVGDLGSIPGSGKFPAGGHGNPFQYSCLENPMDRGAWGATVHGVSESEVTEVAQHMHSKKETTTNFGQDVENLRRKKNVCKRRDRHQTGGQAGDTSQVGT